MAIVRYENLTHSELAALPRDKTVVFVCAGPLEQHGPHLPLGTDPITAAYFGEQLAETIAAKRPEWTFLLFPTIFAGSDTLTYFGSIEVRPRTLRALLLENCGQLARDGFRTQVLVGTHGGPRHMVVLEEVAAKLRWRHRTRAVSASARLLYEVLQGKFIQKIGDQMERSGQALTPAEKDGLNQDYHGGLLETSLMMVAKPELVRPIFKTLEPALVQSYWKLRKNSGKTVGAGLGHLGSPALARPEIGRAAVQVFVDDMAPLLERFIDGAKMVKEFRSKFYYMPFFRTDFNILVFLMLYPALLLLAWLVLSRYLLGVTK